MCFELVWNCGVYYSHFQKLEKSLSCMLHIDNVAVHSASNLEVYMKTKGREIFLARNDNKLRTNNRTTCFSSGPDGLSFWLSKIKFIIMMI